MPALSFNVECETSPGEHVTVVGSHSFLGEWDPQKSEFSLTTDAAQYPEWTGSCELPAGTLAEYKFVVRNGESARWENNDNRAMSVPDVDMQLNAKFNVNGEAVVLSEKEPITQVVASQGKTVEPTKEQLKEVVAPQEETVQPAEEPLKEVVAPQEKTQAPAEEPMKEVVARQEKTVEPAKQPVKEVAASQEKTVEPAEEPMKEVVAPQENIVEPAEEPMEEVVAPQEKTVEPVKEPMKEVVAPQEKTLEQACEAVKQAEVKPVDVQAANEKISNAVLLEDSEVQKPETEEGQRQNKPNRRKKRNNKENAQTAV